MELATEFMDVARIDYDIALTDSKLMDLPRAAVWRSCCCIGPVFFDTDMSLMKNLRIPRWEGAKLQVGAQTFNLLNHPNFDQPINDIANSQCGSIVRTVGPPTASSALFWVATPPARPPDQSANHVLISSPRHCGRVHR
jgi:hypothetical protein